MTCWLLIASLLLGAGSTEDQTPSAAALLARHEKEKSPVWVDGDTATFFYRGDADEVILIVAGETKKLQRLPNSDVWYTTYTKPGMAKGLLSYVLLPGKKGQSIYGRKLSFQRWRGPQAPPAAIQAKDLKGEVRKIEFHSKALGGKREVKLYLPPGFDRMKKYPVLYATDGWEAGALIEPLILSGKLPPLLVVAAANGGYLGEQGKGFDIKKDVRAMEYLPGIDKERHAKHEQFFTQELRVWAEQEWGASPDRKERGVTGCSNGAQFAVDMGVRHPDLYGHVFAFSKGGDRNFRVPDPKPAVLPVFHLAAGEWEKAFHQNTTLVYKELLKQGVPATFVSRFSGHDSAMWDEELAAALVRAFGPLTSHQKQQGSAPG